MTQKKPPTPDVVGIVDSMQARRFAARLGSGALDVFEWRADCLPGVASLPAGGLPWMLTVRHPAEGGAGNLSAPARESLFLRLLPGAAYVDIELRSMKTMRRVLAEAASRGITVIASFHDFRTTPSSAKLREAASRAADSGARIFKVATLTKTPCDIVRLLELFSESSLPLAVMGMGPLGRSSRLLFADCGSVLNYGWLHRPNVPGQWSALELKKMLSS